MKDRLRAEAVIAYARNGFSEDHVPVFAGIVFAALTLLPFCDVSSYVLHISVLVFVYVTLGLGLNMVVGLAGLLDLGYVAFYAVGAYSYAILSVDYHLPFPVALIVGALLAAISGVALGWPTIRARGDYLALVTLGFGEIIRLLLRNWDSLTNGPRGLMDVPPPRLAGVQLSTPISYYYLGLLIGAAAFTLFWRVKRSAVGQQLAAIRDNEDAATAIGINPVRWKLYAFAVGALVAGVAGAFFASWQRFVSPESFTLNESILILSIVVLGGMGRVWPTVGAAAFLVLLPEALREFQNQRMLVLGLFLVLAVVFQEKLRQRRLAQNQRVNKRGESNAAIDSTLSLPQIVLAGSAARFANQFSDSELILSLVEISKNFGGVRALDKVSLQVRRGEIIGLVGGNGAGKTTLFRCIVGAERPDEGKIDLFNGRQQRIDNLPTYKVARQGIVRTFQHGGLFNSLTALENVQIGGKCRDTPSVWEPLRVIRNRQPISDGSSAKLLHALKAPAPGVSVGEMSPVEKKLTELARALATQPDVLLIDEPAASMDEEARTQLIEALREVNRQWGTTLIVIEHDHKLLKSLCRRLVVMDRGKVIADGPVGDIQVERAI